MKEILKQNKEKLLDFQEYSKNAKKQKREKIMRKKFLAALVTGSFLVGMVGVANASLLSFTGTYAEADLDDIAIWGADTVVGSATMDVSVSGTTLTVVVDNTSPTSLTSKDGSSTTVDNTPGITGFGLDLLNFDPTKSITWTLFAKDADNNDYNLTTGSDWNVLVDGNYNGIKVDYTASVQNVKGALYNPAAIAGFADEPNYFTTATLTINFGYTPEVAYVEGESPYIRMKNVGPYGEGSLKMTAPIPEPATLLFFGAGLVGLAGVVRRRNKK